MTNFKSLLFLSCFLSFSSAVYAAINCAQDFKCIKIQAEETLGEVTCFAAVEHILPGGAGYIGSGDTTPRTQKDGDDNIKQLPFRFGYIFVGPVSVLLHLMVITICALLRGIRTALGG